jgi:hypothetical protein
MDWTGTLAELLGLNGLHLVVVVPGPGEQDIGLAMFTGRQRDASQLGGDNREHWLFHLSGGAGYDVDERRRTQSDRSVASRPQRPAERTRPAAVCRRDADLL